MLDSLRNLFSSGPDPYADPKAMIPLGEVLRRNWFELWYQPKIELKTMRLIVLPQAFKTMTTPLGNDLVSMLKDSSLVSVLGIADITQNGKTYTASTFRFFETYTVVAFFYLTMTIGLTLLVRRLEQRMRRNEVRQD